MLHVTFFAKLFITVNILALFSIAMYSEKAHNLQKFASRSIK